MELVILILIGILVLQVLVWLLVFIPFYSIKTTVKSNALLPSVSVIICARNAADDLEKNLPAILEQDFPDFEVIVVNDASTDQTASLLARLEQEYPNLRPIHITSKSHPGKKQALSEGLKTAIHDWILVTDSDCKPQGRSWIRLMMQAADDKKIVLGYGPYKKEAGLLNKLIRFDTAWIAIQYLGFTQHSKPYMAVGRNLGFQKALFEQVGGLNSHMDLISGDDDLFIQEAATQQNTVTSITPESFTYSSPKKKWKDWMKQKSRHLGTLPKYSTQIKWRLLIAQLIPFSFYMIGIPSLFLVNTLAILYLFIVKWLLIIVFFTPAFQKLYEKDLILFIPLLNLIYIFVMPLVGIVNLFTGNKRWN